MRVLRLSLVASLTVVLVTLLAEVKQTDSVYAYAVKGIVKDLRLNPTRFIGGWFFKKAFILKKLKLKWKLKKKLILKKLLKKLLLGVALAKLKGRGGIKIIAPKIILPLPPKLFAHGWGPLKFWAHAPLHLFRRKKRAVRFPDDEHTSSSSSIIGASSSQSNRGVVNHHRQFGESSPIRQSSSSSSNNYDGHYFDRLNVGSLGLSQTDMEQLRHLPDYLKTEYGHEMQELEAVASEPKEEEIQGYLSMASEFDEKSCIPRSICEIMARRNRTSSQFENQVFDYYNEPENYANRRNESPSYAYDYAAYLGKSSHDPRHCASYFPNCPDPNALEKFMNEMFSPELCELPFITKSSSTGSEGNLNALGA